MEAAAPSAGSSGAEVKRDDEQVGLIDACECPATPPGPRPSGPAAGGRCCAAAMPAVGGHDESDGWWPELAGLVPSLPVLQLGPSQAAPAALSGDADGDSASRGGEGRRSIKERVRCLIAGTEAVVRASIGLRKRALSIVGAARRWCSAGRSIKRVAEFCRGFSKSRELGEDVLFRHIFNAMAGSSDRLQRDQLRGWILRAGYQVSPDEWRAEWADLSKDLGFKVKRGMSLEHFTRWCEGFPTAQVKRLLEEAAEERLRSGA